MLDSRKITPVATTAREGNNKQQHQGGEEGRETCQERNNKEKQENRKRQEVQAEFLLALAWARLESEGEGEAEALAALTIGTTGLVSSAGPDTDFHT